LMILMIIIAILHPLHACAQNLFREQMTPKTHEAIH